MLNNKKFNIVISLIIAIGLWAYVIGETNPPDTKTFRDIPIQLINLKTYCCIVSSYITSQCTPSL